MKKFLAIILTAFLLLTFSVTALAEETTSAEGIVTEEVAETEEVVVTEEIEVTEAVSDDPFDFTVDDAFDWIKNNYDKISVVVTLLFYILFSIRKAKSLNKSISTVNNNAVAIAKNSGEAMSGMSTVVTQYKDSMEAMLAEVRKNNDDRTRLEESLAEASQYLKATRQANVELANVMSEILLYANIPNTKKEEFYSRHLAAVNLISELEKAVTEAKEVKENEETNEE